MKEGTRSHPIKRKDEKKLHIRFIFMTFLMRERER